MERRIIYEITTADEGYTIEQFLKKQGYTRQSLVALKKIPESILVDGRWEYVKYQLKAQETLEIIIQEYEQSEKIIPVELPFSVVYEDEDLLVVNKPANMPIHPSMNNYENTLANAAAYYFSRQNKPFVFRCINRLDRDTSGLTILAKHFLSAGILYEQMARREIHREYLAIVEGPFQEQSGTIDKPIGRKEGSTIERQIDYEKGERAVTHYQVLTQSDNYALLSLHLDTGRTHQIRVHMTDAGHPLVGDWLYNPTNQSLPRQALHSHKLTFHQPITNQAMELIAPLPTELHQFLAANNISYKR